MSKNVHVSKEVKLEGYQAILEPGKFGYSLAAVVDSSIIETLESERTDVLLPREMGMGMESWTRQRGASL